MRMAARIARSFVVTDGNDCHSARLTRKVCVHNCMRVRPFYPHDGYRRRRRRRLTFDEENSITARTTNYDT